MKVVIPMITETIAYIESELDELEREDIFRLKKVLANKIKKEREEKMKAAMDVEGEGAGGEGHVKDNIIHG
jgi:V-type H+-transporting ATPase subunit D